MEIQDNVQGNLLCRACENKRNSLSRFNESMYTLRLVEVLRVCFALAQVMWSNRILAKEYCRDYTLG